MKRRTPKDSQRLVAEYERGSESRREFCERRALSTSTLDYWRRRSRGDAGGRLVEIEPGGSFAGVVVPSVVITWPNGVRVEMRADAATAAVLGAMHGAFGRGDSCLR
ncbi:MAG: IS66 family insertion sequence element accessory protein TnpA [Verrucomicrobiales bacterium]